MNLAVCCRGLVSVCHFFLTCSVESDEGRLRDFISTYFYCESLVPCVDKLSRAAEHRRCEGIELMNNCSSISHLIHVSFKE